MRIALAGGGGSSDSLPLDEEFAYWLGPQGRLLYWPIALRDQRLYKSCLDWIVATLAPLNITNITMWNNLSEHHASELDKFDGIYLGGGNTYYLLAQLRESQFDLHIQEFVRRGKPIYGGSAGAVVLGRDIQTINHLDRNFSGVTEAMGLNLIDGHSIWVHYRPEDDPLINNYIHDCQLPVLAISERSGLVLE